MLQNEGSVTKSTSELIGSNNTQEMFNVKMGQVKLVHKDNTIFQITCFSFDVQIVAK